MSNELKIIILIIIMGNSNSRARDTTEEDRIERERIATEKAKAQAESKRKFYESERLKYVNEKDSKYVQILGDIYSKNIANVRQKEKDMNETNKETFKQNSDKETEKVKKSLDEAKQVNDIVSKISQSNNDDDIYKILKQTYKCLKDENIEISTKVYFISEVISKAFGHFYEYNSNNQETQYNYLLNAFPRTFDDKYIKNENSVKNKYKKFISLITLAKISKNITSSELYPYHEEPAIDYFKTLSEPIIKESMSIITEFLDENDTDNTQGKGKSSGEIQGKGQSQENKIKPANIDEQEKYKIMVI